MTRRTPHEQSTDRRRDLLDAAERSIAERGVHATTVADITRAAGVAKGTFYLYFDSREQLLGALKERLAQRIVDAIAEDLTEAGDLGALERLDRVVVGVIEQQLTQRQLLGLTVKEPADPITTERFAEASRHLIELIEAEIRTGMHAGELDVEDPEVTAAMITFGLSGTVHHALLHEEVFDRDRLVAAGQHLMRGALVPPPTGPR